MNANPLKTASVLAFERKLDPSDGLFYAGNWDSRETPDWPAVSIREKSVRGTISNRRKTKEQDPAKLDADIQNPNLQTVDVATLPPDSDTLRVVFTLRILGGAGVPSACNNPDYQLALQKLIDGYKQETGFGELARRYATNLANGRFLWRNRMGSEQIEVQIFRLEHGRRASSWKFDALKTPLRDFDAQSDDLNALSDVVRSGLEGSSHVLLEIIAHARIGKGQEIYPSQELILDKGDKRGQKSKTLYQVDNMAAIHSQKIGNALRTIDTWYPNEEGEPLGPIAVEPYGSVTSQGRAYRQPKQKKDFYTLLDSWVLKGEVLELEEKHYVMANLIRGGVFGDKE